MKILQVGKFYPIRGGVEKVMLDLTLGLSALEGVRCDMLCAATHGSSRREMLGERANLICCRTLVKAAATMISPAMISTLRSIAGDYDVVHVHHPDPMAALALRLSGYKGKVVVHWHSDILKQKKLLLLYKPLQDWLLRRADLILTTSPVYSQASQHLADDSIQAKVRVLPIGIEPLTADATGAADITRRYGGRKIVFSLGRLVPYKGYDFLIRAAKYLPHDYVVVIGGNGPLRQELEQLIVELKLRDKVVLLGGVSARHLQAYYTAASVFCLPSVMKTEAYGIVQIEAMSLGKPVVTTLIEGSGVPWVNAHGESGLNVPVRAPRALANAIVEITSDPVRYAAFCSGARRRYNNVFTREQMINQCLNYYTNQLIQK